MTCRKRIFLCFCLTVLTFAFCVSSYANNTLPSTEYGNDKKTKRIALTFDDGPHPRFTPQILEVLGEYGIRATFFVIGVNVQNYYESYQKIIDSGCEIGNHTYSHVNLNFADSKEIRDEILLCADAIAGRDGDRLLRPPQGACNTEVKRIASELQYDLVFWTIDTMDWAHTGTKEIIDTVLSNASDGDIVLMHDYVSGKSHACEALRVIIPELLSRGFEFVTVSEMMSK